MESRLLETVIALVLYILIRVLLFKSIEKTVSRGNIPSGRIKIIKKAMNLILVSVLIISILIIWGVNQSEIVLFLGSVLTVMGIALFAQWSILSNITSGIILFFHHSVKMDQTIAIIDKDYEISGKVTDIGLFYVLLETEEGDEVSIPNTVFMQKMIKKHNT